jgi:sulfonate dioxygenase
MVANAISPAVLSYAPPDPPLKEFTPARDRAFFADSTKASLLSQASSVEDVTPHIGTELKGVQLSKLTDAQKDELALLVAEVRKAMTFSMVRIDSFANKRRGA